MATRYPIRIGRRSALFLRLWGATPERAWAEIGDGPDGPIVDGPDGPIVVRFGFFEFRTTLGNVATWRIEGPWLWITAIGVRMSIRHRDVSFAGSPHGGVRLDFRERVQWGPIRVPAIYIAADDNDALAADLAARGIPGEDARTERR